MASLPQNKIPTLKKPTKNELTEKFSCMETVFSLKSLICFCIGNENRRIHLGPFLDRDSDDDDNDDDSDDSDGQDFEEWMNNSGSKKIYQMNSKKKLKKKSQEFL